MLVQPPALSNTDIPNNPYVPVDSVYRFARTEYNSIYTTSEWVAEATGMPHFVVLENIRKMIQNDQSRTYYTMFWAGNPIINANGQQEDVYLISVGGFMAYAAYTKMSETMMKAFSSVIMCLSNRIRNNNIQEIGSLKAQINSLQGQVTTLQAATQAAHIPQGEELFALAVLEADKIISKQKVTIAEQTTTIAEQKNIIAQQAQTIADAKPAVDFVDNITVNNAVMSMQDYAVFVTQKLTEKGFKIVLRDVDIYSWLRDNKYVTKRNGRNVPITKALDAELLCLSYTQYPTNNHGNVATGTTRVTPKGQRFFFEEIMSIYKQGGCIHGKRANGSQPDGSSADGKSTDGKQAAVPVRRNQVRPVIYNPYGPDPCVGKSAAPATT